LTEKGVSTNIHFILNSRSVNTAIDWLNSPPIFLKKAHAIVFLNYKPVGRVADESLLLNRSNRLKEFFSLATSEDHSFRVGFDTCTITGLARLGKAHKISLEGCDAGRFSLFVSEKMEVFPCSFMVEAGYSGVSLRNTTLADVWKNHASFGEIRRKHQKGGCSDCSTQGECLSGCPLFPQMNLCPSNCKNGETTLLPILQR
jgi:radical SAM protein with 4Fe4S-binding SPASM domain